MAGSRRRWPPAPIVVEPEPDPVRDDYLAELADGDLLALESHPHPRIRVLAAAAAAALAELRDALTTQERYEQLELAICPDCGVVCHAPAARDEHRTHAHGAEQ